jgi:phage portal protein BeeE
VTRLWDRLIGRDFSERFSLGAADEWTYLMSSYGTPAAEKIAPTFLQYATYGYAGNSVVFSVIGRRISLFSEAQFKWRSLTDKHLFGSAELAKLETPWPNGTTGDLLARMEQDVSLAGNAYIRDAGSQLERLRPDWVTIVSEVSQDVLGREVREVRGYLFEPAGDPDRKPEFYLVDEVAHWAPVPDPLANFRGMSWMTPVIRELDADNAMLAHQQAFYQNSASPNMVIKYQGKLVEQQIERIRNAIAARHAGPRNAGGTMVLDQGADLTIVGDRMQGSAFTELRAAGESRIASAGGTPALIAGLREGMQASQVGEYEQAMRQFADLTMRPNWRGACGALSVLVKVPANSQLWYDTSDITALQQGEQDSADTMSKQATTASTLIMAGYTPESIKLAIVAGDMNLLVHSGMTSVQLYKPGETNSSATPDNPPSTTDAKPDAGKGDTAPPAADAPADKTPGDKASADKAAGRHRIPSRFDPTQPRDPNGKWANDPASKLANDIGDLKWTDFEAHPGEGRQNVRDAAAKRLADNWNVSDADLQALARESGYRAPFFDATPEERKRQFAENEIHAWGSGSGGPVASAGVAAFLDKRGVDYELSDQGKNWRQYFADNPPMQRAAASFIEAMYASTQSWLAERNITQVSVKRQTHDIEADRKKALTSWALPSGGLQLVDGPVRHQETVPAARILSTPATGFGTLEEAELVLLPAAFVAAGKPRRAGRFDPMEPRGPDGKWSKLGAVESAAHHLLTDAEYHDSYGSVHQDYGFADSGHVRVAGGGDITVSFAEDGGHEIFADLGPSDARRLAHNVQWAADADAESGDYNATAPAENGLVNWTVDGHNGLMVGFDPDGNVRVGWPDDNGTYGTSDATGTYSEFDMGQDEADQLAAALQRAAREADLLQ